MSDIQPLSDAILQQAADVAHNPHAIIVSPTQVGYVIITTGAAGLEKMFQIKGRPKYKPAVVLCTDLQQLCSLAKTNSQIEAFILQHWENNTLLGCILPWKKEAITKFIDPKTKPWIMDQQQTSCFVVKPGVPTETIVKSLWDQRQQLCFGSSANLSGQGNQGLIKQVGNTILQQADMVIGADAYVTQKQPGVSLKDRYAQGVMVSMIDEHGDLIPMQNFPYQEGPCPTIIRSGLYIDKIMMHLNQHFLAWNNRSGHYY